MTEVQAESVQFLEPKSGGAGSGGYSGGGNSGGQYYGGSQNDQNPFGNEPSQNPYGNQNNQQNRNKEIASMMTHLRMMVNRLTSPMMICHSN